MTAAADWIDDLERKAKAATPGPWYAHGPVFGPDPGAIGQTWGPNRRNDAKFIAAVNPAAILRLIEDNRRLSSVIKGHEAVAAALIAERDALAARTPCDGGCNYGDGPMEDCSRHGRPPAEVWQIVTEVQAQRDALAARLAAVEALADETERAGDPLLRLDRLRAALSTAPTDTAKENDR